MEQQAGTREGTVLKKPFIPYSVLENGKRRPNNCKGKTLCRCAVCGMGFMGEKGDKYCGPACAGRKT